MELQRLTILFVIQDLNLSFKEMFEITLSFKEMFEITLVQDLYHSNLNINSFRYTFPAFKESKFIKEK